MRAVIHDLHWLTIKELSQVIRDSEITPVELTEYLLRRVDQLDGSLNAFKQLTWTRALGEAEAATWLLKAGSDVGTLHGIPYAAKDLFDVRNYATTAGSPLLASNIAHSDSHVIRRLTQQGMILAGKTNTVQFAYGAVGVNHHDGTPRNPWHREHYVPGGSSSGSAVAVSAGMVPMALGTDTGGSVRVPAALCGTVGLKTTLGQVSRSGVFPLSWSLDTVGILTRCVEDAALVYESIQGRDDDDESTKKASPQAVIRQLKQSIKGLRVAFPEAFFWEGADREFIQAIERCKEVLVDLGATVLPLEFEEASEAHALNARGAVIAAEAYLIHRDRIEQHAEQFDPIVFRRIMSGKGIIAADHIAKMRSWNELRARSERSLRDYDALIVPTTIRPAISLASVEASPEAYVEANLTYLRNTALGNILNLCAVSVPCGFTEAGLPIGAMFYGKPMHEDLILRVAFAYEQATNWHLQRPPL